MPSPVTPDTRATPAGLLAAALGHDGARPLLTFYDDASGERTELSVATFDNWVAKTAGLLQDGLDLEPGARVVIRLPAHWQAAVWLAACWSAGALAVPAPLAATGADLAPLAPDVLVTDLAELATGDAGAEHVVALALQPFALPGSGVPAGVVDYDVEVRGYADRFTPYAPVPPHAPALELPDATLAGGQVVAAGRQAGGDWGLGPGERLLVTEPLTALRPVLGALAAPLATGASVVLTRRPDPAALGPRLVSERVTAALAGDAGLVATSPGVRVV